jgi:dynein heavy chain
MLERNNHVELRPTIQQLFDMTQKVARDLITVVQMVPRLALQATPRQLKELEVSSRGALQLCISQRAHCIC